MIDITVKVPEARVPEFYSMYGAWLNGQAQVLSPSGTRITDGVHEQRPWSESDSALASAVWEKFSDAAKALFSTLIDEPERRFTGEELAEMLEIPNGKHGVGGVLGWPGRHCIAVNRALPWSWEYPVEGDPMVYWLTRENAALFREARDHQG